MRDFLRYLAASLLQVLYFIQSYATPDARKFDDDGHEIDHDALPLKDKHTINLRLLRQTQQHIQGTARIVAAKPVRLNRKQKRLQAQMEKVLMEFEAQQATTEL